LRSLGPRGYLVLTWDEGNSNRGCCGGLAAGGQIPTVIAGAGVKRGASLAGPYTHYSTLRLIEDSLRLPRLREAARPEVKSLGDAFTAGVPRLR
jgi:phosphatidylinositol-3-phosphatase